MTLHQPGKGNVTNLAKKIRKALEERESSWNADQKNLLLKWIKEKLSNSEKSKDYSKTLLQSCKSFGGLCTTSGELQSALVAKPDLQKKIVKAELTLYQNTNKIDMLAQPDSFKVNKITHQEHLEIIMILLTDDDYATGSIADLPSNEDALTINKGELPDTELTASSSEIKINDTYVIA